MFFFYKQQPPRSLVHIYIYIYIYIVLFLLVNVHMRVCVSVRDSMHTHVHILARVSGCTSSGECMRDTRTQMSSIAKINN